MSCCWYLASKRNHRAYMFIIMNELFFVQRKLFAVVFCESIRFIVSMHTEKWPGNVENNVHRQLAYIWLPTNQAKQIQSTSHHDFTTTFNLSTEKKKTTFIEFLFLNWFIWSLQLNLLIRINMYNTIRCIN